MFCLLDRATHRKLSADCGSNFSSAGSRAVRHKLCCCYLFGLISRANQRNEASRRRGSRRQRRRVSRRIKKFPRHQQIFCVMTQACCLTRSLVKTSRPNFSVTRVLRSLRREAPCAARVEQGSALFWLTMAGVHRISKLATRAICQQEGSLFYFW